MARTTISNSSHESTSSSEHHSQSQSQSQSTSESKKVLDEKLLAEILSGLTGYMTDEEIQAYAENLLMPQRDAQIEAAKQQYETQKLLGEQEIADLAAALSAGVAEQERSYAKSAANIQTAALARGMGRSSYALDTLSNEGDRLARAVREMTQENERKSAQVREKMALEAQQSTQTQSRVNTDYAAQLAAKVQEIRREQNQQYNQNYLTAVAGSMGTSTSGQTSTKGTTDTTGTTQTQGSSTTVTTSYGSGGSGKKQTDQVDAISGAAPSVKYRR